MAPELIKEFLIDCYENLDRLDAELVALEQDPRNATRLASAFRTVHTIKGAAGFLAFTKLEAITHVGENLMTKVRDGRMVLDQDVTSGLLRMIDAIRQIASHIEQHETEPEVEYADLVAVLQELAGREGRQGTAAPAASAAPAPAAASPAPPAVTPEPAPVAQAPAPTPMPSPAPTPLAQEPLADPKDFPQDLRSGDDRRAGDDRRGGTVADTALRVNVDLLDRLMNLVGELVLARNQIVQLTADESDGGLVSARQRLDLVTSELQEGVMKTRMQPIGNIWSKFPRVVRDVATHCGKQVRIEMEGKETELDKTIIEAIKDPLTHIVRNSVDHGIESPEVRLEKGKPVEGLLLLRAFHEGGQINIEIVDDGAGIDPEKVRASAVKKGVLSAEQAARLSDQDAIRLIFRPGFSTAEQITNISGRGVGMDVVKTNIERIGGQVDIQSRIGEGTTLKIKIPLTLAIIPALIVTGADGARYAIPQVNLTELVRLDRDGDRDPIEYINDAPFYRLRGRLLPLIYLHRELAIGGDDAAATRGAVNVVVLKADGQQFGLIVDRINDTEEIVVKPLGKHFKHLRVFAGATIMGDGTVALILDVMGLAERAHVLSDRAEKVEGHAGEPGGATDGHVRQSMLVFAAGRYERLAIPLSAITRLEEFAPDVIEQSGVCEVVQYGKEIMPLIDFWSAGSNPESMRPAIVLAHGQGHLALQVDRIVDIVDAAYTLEPMFTHHGVVGSAVIDGQVTQIVDVEAVVAASGFQAAAA